MADAGDSKSLAPRHAGSTPALDTRVWHRVRAGYGHNSHMSICGLETRDGHVDPWLTSTDDKVGCPECLTVIAARQVHEE